MNTSWRDLKSCIRLKCSFSIIFSTLTLFPALHPSLLLTASSNPCLLPDPFSQLGDARVDTGLVPTSTALAPAHNAGLEPLPTLLKTHQGAPGVSLVSAVRGDRLLYWVWMWEHDNYMGVKTYLYQPFVLFTLFWRTWLYDLTWHASTPPAKNPLQSILEVTCPSVTTLHTVSLMIFTDAFCSSCAFWPAKAGQRGQRSATWPPCSSLTSKVLMGWISVS